MSYPAEETKNTMKNTQTLDRLAAFQIVIEPQKSEGRGKSSFQKKTQKLKEKEDSSNS